MQRLNWASLRLLVLRTQERLLAQSNPLFKLNRKRKQSYTATEIIHTENPTPGKLLLGHALPACPLYSTMCLVTHSGHALTWHHWRAI